MGWRVAGIVIGLWAFNVAMYEPILAVCIGLLAGWLFGRGRRAEPAAPRPQATSPSGSLSAPSQATREPNAPSSRLPPIGLPPNSATPTGGPPKPRASGEDPNGQVREVAVEGRPPDKPIMIAPDHRHDRPAIVTRTSSAVAGLELTDPYAGKEKRWTRAEQLELLDLYVQGKSIMNMAQTMRIDQKQVAIKLIRLLLTPSGDIENADECPRNGKKYTQEELCVMEDLQRKGIRLRTMANEVQRTQLGVGWRLLDMHIPQVRAGLRGGLRSDI